MTTDHITGAAIVLAVTSVAHKLGGVPDHTGTPTQRDCDWDALTRMLTDERGVAVAWLTPVWDTVYGAVRLTVCDVSLGVAYEARRPAGRVAT